MEGNIYIIMTHGYWFPDEVQTVLRELYQTTLDVHTANLVVVIFDPTDRLSIFQLEDLSHYLRQRYRPHLAERQRINPVDFKERYKPFLKVREGNDPPEGVW